MFADQFIIQNAMTQNGYKWLLPPAYVQPQPY